MLAGDGAFGSQIKHMTDVWCAVPADRSMIAKHRAIREVLLFFETAALRLVDVIDAPPRIGATCIKDPDVMG
jgi:hypothetical protein